MRQFSLAFITIIFLIVIVFVVPNIYTQDVFPDWEFGFWSLNTEDKLFILHLKAFWLLQGLILMLYALYLYFRTVEKGKPIKSEYMELKKEADV